VNKFVVAADPASLQPLGALVNAGQANALQADIGGHAPHVVAVLGHLAALLAQQAVVGFGAESRNQLDAVALGPQLLPQAIQEQIEAWIDGVHLIGVVAAKEVIQTPEGFGFKRPAGGKVTDPQVLVGVGIVECQTSRTGLRWQGRGCRLGPKGREACRHRAGDQHFKGFATCDALGAGTKAAMGEALHF
jgi:hypothetical protein